MTWARRADRGGSDQGADHVALSGERDEFLKCDCGQLSAPGHSWGGQLGGRALDAQHQVLAVGDEDVPDGLRRCAHSQHREAATEERVGGVGHLDVGRFIFRRILEWGRPLLGRSIASTTRRC